MPLRPGWWSAGAAIISPGLEQPRIKVACQLPSGSSAEAELAAALLGFGVLEAEYGATLFEPNVQCRWNYDFASLRVHATKREKGFCFADLLEVYSSLLREVAITVSPEFLNVKSHSGVRLNEACDRACRWVLNDGEKLLRRYGAGLVGRNAVLAPEEAWLLCDLRPIFEELSGVDSEPSVRSWWVDFVAFLREFTTARS